MLNATQFHAVMNHLNVGDFNSEYDRDDLLVGRRGDRVARGADMNIWVTRKGDEYKIVVVCKGDTMMPAINAMFEVGRDLYKVDGKKVVYG